MTADPVTAPDVQRRNLILGLILGGFVVAMITTWVLVFTREGLPKDPTLWQQMQKSLALPEAAPATSPASTSSH